MMKPTHVLLIFLIVSLAQCRKRSAEPQNPAPPACHSSPNLLPQSLADVAVTTQDTSAAGHFRIVKALLRADGASVQLQAQWEADKQKSRVQVLSPQGALWGEFLNNTPDAPLTDIALLPGNDIVVSQVKAVPNPEGGCQDHCFSLWHLDAQAGSAVETVISDPALINDPATVDEVGQPFEPDSVFARVFSRNRLRPHWKTPDAIRLATLQNGDVVMALQNMSGSLLLYRYAWQSPQYVQRWRQMIEPAMISLPSHVIASFETFDIQARPYQPLLALNERDEIFVGLLIKSRFQVLRHNEVLRDTLTPPVKDFLRDDTADLLITRVTPGGERLQSRLLTHPEAPLMINRFSIKAKGDHIYSVGRIALKETPIYEAGLRPWDALFEKYDFAKGAFDYIRTYTISRGEAWFDLMLLGSDHVLAVGSVDWDQVQTASIIRYGTAHVALLNAADGALKHTLWLPRSSRNDIAESIALSPSELLISGSYDAPITHTADQNPALLSSGHFQMRWPLNPPITPDCPPPHEPMTQN